jgi:hypothetical protein
MILTVSNPPEHRMEEMLYYRTKPEEREAHYVNGTGKVITVGVAKTGTRARAARPPSAAPLTT